MTHHDIKHRIAEAERRRAGEMTSYEERFAQNWRETVFLVEANSFERMALWREHADRMSWDEETLGSVETIGTVKEVGKRRRPICVAITWALILGKRVAFYEATSQIVDFDKVERWVDSKEIPRWDGGSRRAHCDAMNFGHCLAALRERPGGPAR